MPVTWFDGVTLTLEAALSAATGTYGVWDSSVWDTATWGPDVIWTDISADILSIRTSRKFGREVNTWEAGTATIELKNWHGNYAPDNLSGPYVSGGITQVRPWRPIRLSATYAGVTYRLFAGYATAWEQSYSGGPNSKAIVTVPCVDELGRLARFNGYAQTPAGAGETSGVRVHRVLNNAGHTGPRAIDVGKNTLQATALAANAVTELKLDADSEGGALYIDGDGTVIFDGQGALIENARSNTSQATFGDGAGEIGYADVTPDYSGDLVVNLAAYARVGGTVQTAADNSSRALYGDMQDSRSDLVCQTDAQASSLATLKVLLFKNPETRITQMSLVPRANPAVMFPQALGRRIRDRITVKRRPPSTAAYTINKDVFVSGITHTITGDNWRTVFDLWTATGWGQFGTWDSAIWDTTAWYM